MDGIKITDYSIFDKASSTTNTLIEKTNEIKGILEKTISTLSENSVFEGPICNECLNSLKEAITKLESINSNYANVKNHFNEVSTKYKKGDKEGADNVLSVSYGSKKGSDTSKTTKDKEGKTVTTDKTTSKNGCSEEAETMIENAMGVIGSPWVTSGYYWSGDPNTSYFTCSGLVDYALGRPEHSSSPESLRDEIGMENLTTDVSQLKKGDLVFYRYDTGHPDGWGHVGIYLGDNQIIDSSTGGVQIRDVNYMELLGGGTLV